MPSLTRTNVGVRSHAACSVSRSSTSTPLSAKHTSQEKLVRSHQRASLLWGNRAKPKLTKTQCRRLVCVAVPVSEEDDETKLREQADEASRVTFPQTNGSTTDGLITGGSTNGAYLNVNGVPNASLRLLTEHAAVLTGHVTGSGHPVVCHEPPTIVDLCSICHSSECVAVMVRFKWSAKWGGETVALSGTFNDWEEIAIERSPNGDFVQFLSLQPGTYQYKFKVDGRWLTSLEEPRVDDGKNNMNNQVTVAEAVTYRWRKEWGGSEVFVVGNDTNWTERLRLELDDNGDFALSKSLPVGTYRYKFLVDGEWRCSPEEPTQRTAQNVLNNCVTVAADASVTLFYKSGWSKARLLLQNNEEDCLTEVPFGMTKSDYWMRVSVPVNAAYLLEHAMGATEGLPALEFIVTEGVEEGSSDVPPSGGFYKCPHPGGYKLTNGYLTPFPKARAPPVMVCTDLDGTMVGDGPEFDAGTLAFRKYWEDTAGLAGGVLVFNTGRSIGAVCSLFVEKSGMLAVPNTIITAVGTKIFDRLLAFPPEDVRGWIEDESWAHQLDEGWDLLVVREVCEEAVSDKWQKAAYWLDKGTEHPHRCSLSVHLPCLDKLLEYLRSSFKERDLQVQVIVSGAGDWRYVDCVALRAGKLGALNYVRRKFGIPKEQCAACGDSGNDTLMLDGENPAIVVGNAQPDLREWVLNQVQDGRVVLTDAKGAYGILEGLASLKLY